MLFKEKLVILRKTRHLTQDEFASAVGVSRQAVYKWESGQSYPEVPKLLEMKNLLGISIDDLLDDNYDVPLPEKKRRRRRKKAVEAEAATEVKEEEKKPVPAPTPAPAPAPAVEEVEVEEEVVIEDNDNGFEVEDAPDINMPGHVAVPKFVQVNIPGAKKNDSKDEKRSSFFSKFFSKK